MTRRQTLLALACAFVLGGAAASQLVATAHAQTPAQPPSPRKWQQFCSFRGSFADAGPRVVEANADMKAKGDAGWELVSMSNADNVITYCFKRPVP